MVGSVKPPFVEYSMYICTCPFVHLDMSKGFLGSNSSNYFYCKLIFKSGVCSLKIMTLLYILYAAPALSNIYLSIWLSINI